jgi:hypothetical protein
MRRQILTLLSVGLIGLLHPSTTHAGPLDFMFSFTGTVPPGSVAGTVTGEIFGLTNNASGSASNVVIDSYPAGLGLPTPPLTIFSNITSNSFTVMNNAITDADYFAFDAADLIGLLINFPTAKGQNLNELENLGTTANNTVNLDGLAGITFTLVPSVPEPASVTLLATALALLWPLRRRGRRLAAPA